MLLSSSDQPFRPLNKQQQGELQKLQNFSDQYRLEDALKLLQRIDDALPALGETTQAVYTRAKDDKRHDGYMVSADLKNALGTIRFLDCESVIGEIKRPKDPAEIARREEMATALTKALIDNKRDEFKRITQQGIEKMQRTGRKMFRGLALAQERNNLWALERLPETLETAAEIFGNAHTHIEQLNAQVRKENEARQESGKPKLPEFTPAELLAAQQSLTLARQDYERNGLAGAAQKLTQPETRGR